jgi:hypothetical protein
VDFDSRCIVLTAQIPGYGEIIGIFGKIHMAIHTVKACFPAEAGCFFMGSVFALPGMGETHQIHSKIHSRFPVKHFLANLRL